MQATNDIADHLQINPNDSQNLTTDAPGIQLEPLPAKMALWLDPPTLFTSPKRSFAARSRFKSR